VLVALDSLRGLVGFSSTFGFSMTGLSTNFLAGGSGFVWVLVQLLVWAGLLGSDTFVLADGDAVEVVDATVLFDGLVTGVVVVLVLLTGVVVTELRGEVGLFPPLGLVALGDVFSMLATADWTAEDLFVGVEVLDPMFNFGGGVLVSAVFVVDDECNGEVGWLVLLNGDKSLSRAVGCDGELLIEVAWVACAGLDAAGELVVGVFFGGR
jgi:hypothetical protein